MIPRDALHFLGGVNQRILNFGLARPALGPILGHLSTVGSSHGLGTGARSGSDTTVQ